MLRHARYTILPLLLVLAGVANAQLVSISGTIQRADGSYPTGTATIQNQQFVSGGVTVVAATKVINVVNGVISTSLYSTQNTIPPGVSYRVTYQLSGSPSYQRVWVVPLTGPVTVTQIEFPLPGLVGTTAIVSPAQLTPAGATLSECLIFNGSIWTPGTCSGSGSSSFSSITTGTNSTATMTIASGATLTSSGGGIVNANSLLGGIITGFSGNTGRLQEVTGNLVNGKLVSGDSGGNTIDSGITAANVILSSGSYPDPSWITSLAGSKITGSLPCVNWPATTGDVTKTAGSCATSVTTTAGLPFAPSATIDTTNATNITVGTLAGARMTAVNLASSGNGGVTGNLPVTNLNGGVNASGTTVWAGDGTWKSIAGGGTVTHTSGPLTAGAVMVGNGANDANVLSSLGTTTTLLHGNAGGTPSWSSVSLTADVSGILPTANGGLNSASIAFSGPSGGAKTFALPNASATILTTNALVTLAQGGTGVDLSAIDKGGLIVGTALNTVAVKTVGTDGFVLVADSASTGGVKWAVNSAGTGTVTSIATTTPITGGTITATGTIACPTCVTSAASLTVNRLVLGAGSQASAVLGSLGTSTTVLHGNSGGAPSFGAVGLTTDVTGVLPPANGGSPWTASGSDIYFTGGKVGIGGAPVAWPFEIIADGSNSVMQMDTYNSLDISAIVGRAARGTKASPLPAQDTNTLFIIEGQGFGSTVWGTASAEIAFTATENYTDAAKGMKIVFQTASNGTTTPVDRMTIDQSGNVGVGVASPASKITAAGTIYSTSGGFKFPDATTRATAGARIAEVADYNFAAITPTSCTGCGSSGSATITLPQAPLGMNAANAVYTVYLSGGTGAAEVVPVTGGTCTPLASACTIVVTLGNAHTGGYTVKPATAGLQECIYANQGGNCHAIAGTYLVYGPAHSYVNGMKITGDGSESTLFQAQGDGIGILDIDNSGWTIEDVWFGTTALQTTGGYAARLGNSNSIYFARFNRIRCEQMYNCLVSSAPSASTGVSQWWVTNSRFYNFYNDAIVANADNGTSDGVGPQISGNIFFNYSLGGHAAEACLKILATGVINFTNNFCAGNSDGPTYLNYGVYLTSTASTGLVISNNDFQSTSVAAISLNGTWDSATVTGNVIDIPGYMDTSGAYGILVTNGSGAGVLQGTITGNQIQGAGTTNWIAVDIEGATANWAISSNSIKNANKGYYLNSSGTVTVGPSNMQNVTIPVDNPTNTATMALPTATAFAQLNGVNGSMIYCSNCTVASTCASGGSGAIAKKLNSVWVCN